MVNENNYAVGKDLYSAVYALKYSNGDYSLERPIPIPIYSDNDQIHTVMDGETLQSIAYRYYGDSGYWYQIAEANNIINPFSDSEVFKGRQLIIPLYGIIE